MDLRLTAPLHMIVNVRELGKSSGFSAAFYIMMVSE
jgi:hypothetical protein